MLACCILEKTGREDSDCARSSQKHEKIKGTFCAFTPPLCKRGEAKLVAIMDREKDSLRIYNLGNHYGEKITHYGVKPGYDPGGTLMV